MGNFYFIGKSKKKVTDWFSTSSYFLLFGFFFFLPLFERKEWRSGMPARHSDSYSFEGLG